MVNDMISRRGLMFVLSSPSGAGKTTLSRRFLSCTDNLSLSVSVTTRPPRRQEEDGRDYYFISESEFMSRREGGDFLEWARVFGHYYATLRARVESVLCSGSDILFDIDWQGTQQLSQSMGDDLVRVFILPPSSSILRDRLISRGQDSDLVISHRLSSASSELSHWAEYDYVIVNDDLDETIDILRSILHAERHKRSRRTGLDDFVRHLRSDLD